MSAAAINNEIVNDATLFIQQQSVLPVRAISRRSTLLVSTVFNQRVGRRSRHLKLAHMRNVKDSDVLTNSLVFIKDA